MAEQVERHLVNGSWYLTAYENLEKILFEIGEWVATF